MTDVLLRSLGFAPTTARARPSQAAFNQAWRYRYDHAAADGAYLFVEHPLGIGACWLSEQEFPIAAQDIVARIALNDQPALQAATTAFFAAHGGIGSRIIPVDSTLRPLRRLL